MKAIQVSERGWGKTDWQWIKGYAGMDAETAKKNIKQLRKWHSELKYRIIDCVPVPK